MHTICCADLFGSVIEQQALRTEESFGAAPSTADASGSFSDIPDNSRLNGRRANIVATAACRR
jgi:hypothetical protein